MYEVADSMSGFLLTLLVAHLATPAGGKRINQHMSGLQIFRLSMESIAHGNIFDKVLFIQSAGAGSVGAEVISLVLFCLLNNHLLVKGTLASWTWSPPIMKIGGTDHFKS